jgi:hypothetical protein
MVENGRQLPSRLITVTLNLDTGEMEGGWLCAHIYCSNLFQEDFSFAVVKSMRPRNTLLMSQCKFLLLFCFSLLNIFGMERISANESNFDKGTQQTEPFWKTSFVCLSTADLAFKLSKSAPR